MFFSALKTFKNKFLNEKIIENSVVGSSINSNSNEQNDEEKKSTDSEYIEDIKLSKLLSLKDKDGNTPILFASYRGSISIIIKMIELGVKYDIQNKAGLDIIHMAAQSDKANVIIYFKEKYNYDLYKNDNHGNNSIHWASSNSAKFALKYLLYYLDEKNKEIINSQNKNGQTALHLAILTNSSTDIIKKLIKKGINPDIKDKNGLTVFDIPKDNIKYQNINKLINDYSKTNCIGLNYHVNDFKNKYFKFFVFIISSIFQIFCTNYFLIPFLDENTQNQKEIKLIYYSLSLVFMFFFVYIVNSNAGNISEKISDSLLNLVIQKKDIRLFCPYCKVNQKIFSKHCFICNQCIEIYDHHCHWINNCIGKQNKFQFIIFLIILLIYLCFSYFISLESLIIPISENYSKMNYLMSVYKYKIIISFLLTIINLFFCLPIGYILYNQIMNQIPPKPHKNETKEYYKELKEVNDKNNIVNQLQIKED